MSIIAFIDRSSSTTSTLKYAAWASTTLEQPLVLVAMIDGGVPDPSWSYDEIEGLGGREELYREMIPAERIEDPAAENAAIEIVQKAAREAREIGIEHIRTETSPETLAYFIEHSTNSDDLLVFGRDRDSDQLAGRQMDEVLRLRKRVMLLAPDSFSPPRSWLMALDGGASSGRAVEYLIRNPLIKDVPGKAAIVGSDSQNRIHFRDAIKHLQSAGYTVNPHELQGGADDVLAAVLQVTPVDLLVMGAYGGGRFRTFFERSTTSRLLGTFKGPVLVARN